MGKCIEGSFQLMKLRKKYVPNTCDLPRQRFSQRLSKFTHLPYGLFVRGQLVIGNIMKYLRFLDGLSLPSRDHRSPTPTNFDLGLELAEGGSKDFFGRWSWWWCWNRLTEDDDCIRQPRVYKSAQDAVEAAPAQRDLVYGFDGSVGGWGHFVFVDLPKSTTVWFCSCTRYSVISGRTH